MTDLLEQLRETYDGYEYELPSLNDLAFAFELRDAIIHEGFVPEHLLRFIRRRIVQVLDGWANYLHSIIMPGEQSLVLYEEASHFGEQDKEVAMQLLRKIMRLNRMSVILEVEQSEARDAEYINEAFGSWEQLHVQLRPLLEKSLSVWEDKE